MSLLLYMDQHVPSAVTHGLRARGVDVLTAFEDGSWDWEDEALLGRAASLGRVLFTQDAGFFALAHTWASRGREFPGVIFAAQGRLSIGQMIEDLNLACGCLDPAEIAGRVTWLPFR